MDNQSNNILAAEVDRLAPNSKSGLIAAGIELPPNIVRPIPPPGTPNPILKFFNYSHLPTRLQPIAQQMQGVAHLLNDALPDSAEKSAGLRKLLEAKDCFVRAAME